jgi:protein-tyrosine-phosphatase
MTIQTSAADDSRSGKKNVGAILFACNINAVRSAMAEAMVKVTFPKEIFVDSCGVAPGNPDGFAIAVIWHSRRTVAERDVSGKTRQ